MIDYDGRRFSPAGHDENHDQDHDEDHGEEPTVAAYRQRGDLLWADFTGGRVRRGALTGVCRPDDTLEFSYTMVLTDGVLVVGHCESTPEVLPDGRIRLHERWERYRPTAETGVSLLEEIDPG